MSSDFRISIKPSAVATVLLIVACAYGVWLLRHLVLLVLTSIVIASAIEPWIAFLIRRRIPRFFAAIFIYVSVLGAFFCILYFFFPPIISDAAGFLSALPQYLGELHSSVSLQFATSAPALLRNAGDLQSFIQTMLAIQSAFVSNSGGALQIISTFFGGILSLALVVVLSFYLALQDTGVDDFLRLVMPLKHEEYAVNLWKRSQRKIGLWMQGQILLSVIVGILVYLGLLIVEVPYALLLAVFTAIAEIIPIFGSLLAGGIAAIVGYTSGGIPIALIVIGLYIVVNQFESNLIYPLIVKKIVGVPPLLVIVALIAGYTLAGFLGVLLSVPVAAVALEFISDFDKRKRSAVATH